jgi:two-component system sensor histidine kinase KdpD
MVAFNFFFLPPVRTFSVTEPSNLVALAVFFFTALTVGQLSARARDRAAEAEAGKQEIERLYEELQDAFERASHAEALRQSERLKSALLDAVTHDLRTPLTSIKASVTTLLDQGETGDTPEPLDDDIRQELLEVINEEADRLNRFIEGMVELARIEAGEMNLRRTWGSVDEILTSATARAARLTERKQVQVEVEPELPAIRVDARAVAEVVYALLDNAAKHGPPGSTIRITAKREAGEMIEIAVVDEGPGIPESAVDRIFDKFYQADDTGQSGANHPTGIGMGLAIARGIVEAHGGRIYAEAGPGGVGARVAFQLPTGDD